jgi:hypothetical protein
MIKNNKAEMNRMRAMMQHQRANRDNRSYYWVYGYTKREGKPIVYGWFDNEPQLHQWAFTYTNGNYDSYLLPTKNRPTATSMIKAKRLETEKIDLDEAITRVRHQGKDIGVEDRNNQ